MSCIIRFVARKKSRYKLIGNNIVISHNTIPLEARRVLESEEHIKLFENLIRLYYKKVKKIHDNLKNCMYFFGTYKKVSLDELDDEFMNLIPLLAKKADEYILKNKDIICI